MNSQQRSLGQKVCLVLAWLCWIVAAPLAALSIFFMFDSGPHGSFEYFWIFYGICTLLPAGFGILLYLVSRPSVDLTKNR